ncbi:S41 family peptidase [Parabacteroides pacaensis]|uniref:S41 family peptidase n=1 Tax=Parabacteroides pacaensis TaxID=2086575 RepID=UPI000D10D659|nr:S41 family peptidase [Parabacteroides pacaensis]
MKKLIFLFILFTTIVKLEAQQSETLTAEQMQEDINYYFDFLKNNHPNLYLKYSPAQYDSLQQETIKKCTLPLTHQAFNKVLFDLNCYFDGHTRIQSNYLWGNNKSFYFPYFRILNDSLFLNNEIIQTVNNMDMKEVIRDIEKGASSWENHPNFNETRVNLYTSLYLSTFYNIKPPYYLQLKNTQTNKIYVDTIAERKPTADFNLPFQFKFYPEESIAILFYNSCALSEEAQKGLKKALDIAFKKIKKLKIKYLFIDLRLNEGGSIMNNELIFNYLKSKKYVSTLHVKANIHTIPQAIAELQERNRLYLEKNKSNFWKTFKMKRLIKKLNKKIPSVLSTGIDVLKEKIPANRRGFKEKVFVIQGRKTFSAAVKFTLATKQQQVGLIVGEEGGGPVCFSADGTCYDLPNSKISFSCPGTYAWQTPEIPTKNGFLQPDIKYDVFGKTLEIEDYKKIIQLSKALEEQ